MRTTVAVSIALLAGASLPSAAWAEGKAPVLLVQPGPESGKPFVFLLKGSAGEVLCTSEGYKKAKAAEKAAHAAKAPGSELKHYLFEKATDAKGEHHFWEVREGKKNKALLCRSGPVDDRAQAEHSAALATKAFAQATVAVK